MERYICYVPGWIDCLKGVILLKLPCKFVTMSIKRASPGCSAGKESACNAGDLDLIPGLGSSIKRTDLFSYVEGGAGGW